MDVATSVSPVTLSVTSLLTVDSDEYDSFCVLDPTPSMANMSRSQVLPTLSHFELENEDQINSTEEIEKLKLENNKLRDEMRQHTDQIKKQYQSIFTWKEKEEKYINFYKDAADKLKKRTKELEAQNNELNKQLANLKQIEQEKLYKDEELKGKQTAEIIWLKEEINTSVQKFSEVELKLKLMEAKEQSFTILEEKHQEDNKNFEEIISHIQDQTQEYKIQNEKLKTETSLLIQTIHDYEEEIAAHEQVKETLKQTLAQQLLLIEKIKEYERKMESFIKDNAALNNLKEEKNLAVEKINALEIERQCLKTENETLKYWNEEKNLLERTTEDLQKKVQMFETENTELKGLKGEIEALKQLTTNLQEKAQGLLNENQVITKEKQALETEMLSLKHINKELSEKHDIIKALEDFTFVDRKGDSINLQEVQTSQQSLQSSTTIPKQLEGAMASTSSSSQYFEKFQTMVKQSMELENVMKEFHIERSSEQEKLMILEAQEQYHQEKLDTMTAILLSKEQDMEQYKQELSVAIKKNTDLEVRIREGVAEEINDLNQKVAQLEEQLDAEKRSRETSEQEVKTQQELIETIFNQTAINNEGASGRTYDWQRVDPTVPENACPKCNHQCENTEDLISHVSHCLTDDD